MLPKVNVLQHGPSPFKDAVLTHAIKAAEKNGRVITIMYDISGCDEALWAKTILKDWQVHMDPAAYGSLL